MPVLQWEDVSLRQLTAAVPQADGEGKDQQQEGGEEEAEEVIVGVTTPTARIAHGWSFFNFLKLFSSIVRYTILFS